MTFTRGAMSVFRISNLFLRVNVNREMDDQLRISPRDAVQRWASTI